MKKPLLRSIDWTFGALLRFVLRYLVIHPLIRLNYRVTISGGEAALECTEGAIIVANHISRIDGPFLMSEAWPYARIRPTAWHAEYSHWLQWPLMKLFGTIPLSSPKYLPDEERQRRKEEAIGIMDKVLAAGRHLLIFAEGGIGDGSRVSIKPHLSGVFKLIEAHHEKPLLLVKIEGLEHSRFGKHRLRGMLFKRLPVHVTITRADNISLVGGHEGLNNRIERFYNEGISLVPERTRRGIILKI